MDSYTSDKIFYEIMMKPYKHKAPARASKHKLVLLLFFNVIFPSSCFEVLRSSRYSLDGYSWILIPLAKGQKFEKSKKKCPSLTQKSKKEKLQ